MNTQLNYHHLRYFLAVASEGGIKAASDALHVSPPTLSAQVKALEDFLGTPLFLREGKALVLTDAGRMVKRYAERIYGFGDEMIEVIRRGGPVGPEAVFVGIVDALPKLLASRVLVKALEELPLLHVVVREGLPGELFPALAAHQLDIVIANSPPAAPLKTALFSTKAGRHGVRFVASPELKQTYRSRSGLSGFPVLLPTRESPLRRELDRWWAEKKVVPKIRAEFDDAAAMWEMAAAGAGATPVIDAVMPDLEFRYGLSELPLKTGIHEELYVVTAERQFSHEGQRAIARLAGAVARK